MPSNHQNQNISGIIENVVKQYLNLNNENGLITIGRAGIKRANDFLDAFKKCDNDEQRLIFINDQIKNGMGSSKTFRGMVMRAYNEFQMPNFNKPMQLLLQSIYFLQDNFKFMSVSYYPLLENLFDKSDNEFHAKMYVAIAKKQLFHHEFLMKKYLQAYHLLEMPRHLDLLVLDTLAQFIQEEGKSFFGKAAEIKSAQLLQKECESEQASSIVDSITKFIKAPENNSALRDKLADDLCSYYQVPKKEIKSNLSFLLFTHHSSIQTKLALIHQASHVRMQVM